jgi:hypothetical protein
MDKSTIAKELTAAAIQGGLIKPIQNPHDSPDILNTKTAESVAAFYNLLVQRLNN